MATCNVSLKIYGKKKQMIYLKAKMFLFFSEALSMIKLLKKREREIFVLLDIFFSRYTP